MSKDPAVLFYTSAWLSGTLLFTPEQKGYYIDLLCIQHQIFPQHIPKDQILRVCGSYDVSLMKKFAVDDDGNYFNERMEIEIKKRLNYCESRKLASHARKILTDHTIDHTKDHTIHRGKNKNKNIIKDVLKITKQKTIKGKYLDYVYLTDDEYSRLLKECGQRFLDRCIFILDEWFSNGGSDRYGRYRDHNKCIRKWVIDRVEKEGYKKQPVIEPVKRIEPAPGEIGPPEGFKFPAALPKNESVRNNTGPETLGEILNG